MSDKNHTGEKALHIWLDAELLQQFDSALKQAGYRNRAEFVREKVRELIREYKEEGK